MYINTKNKFLKTILLKATQATIIAICFFRVTWICAETKINKADQRNSPVVYLFSHGYGGNGSEVVHYSPTFALNNRYIIGLNNNEIKTFDYPDCKYFSTHALRPTGLAQTEDINALKNAYNEIIKQNPTARVVLHGPSRGASTIPNFLGEHNPENIAAIILESPFDHGESIAQDRGPKFLTSLDENLVAKHRWLRYLPLRARWISYMPFSSKIMHMVMAHMLVHYKTNGQQPINSVTKIKNKQLPILIIYSKQDKLIPWQSTVRLYNKFKKEGFANCHLVMLERGEHANLLWGSDGQKYHDEVQKFYKQYNLPYIQ